MNILDVAYRIGQQMKTIPIGREWIELYTQLTESISPESWETFLKTSRGLLNYYSFAHASEVIEENSLRNDLPQYLQEQLKELKASQQLKRLCELSIILGDNLNEMLTSAMAPRAIPKDFGKLQASPKLSRSIKDIHMAFQRSGILKSTLRYLDPKTNEFPSILNTFYEVKNSHATQMSSGIRKVVRNLGSTVELQRMLTVMYISDLLFDITKQMVFESHLKRIVNIPSESIVRAIVKNVKGIRPVYLSLDATMLTMMKETSRFMVVQLAGTAYTVIITSRQLRIGRDVPDGFKMTIKGFLYPQSDVELLDQLIDV
ncbi:hypothetical protein ABHN11_00030 [Brevibacillus centrosporus]|uniref:hypothetical protein n=1 Tax=Brevibacillus centrosporus TaxID=54910 RepID=UPI003D1936D7